MASWPVVLLGFLFLTCNSAIAIHRSGGDAATILFVGVTYASVVLLLHCLRRFEASPPGSPERDDRARAGVWLTTTLLTAMFSWRVSVLMPPPLAAAACLTGCATVIWGFYALFLLPSPATDDD